MHTRRNVRLCISFILLLVTCCTVEVFPANEKPVPENLLLKDFRPKSVYNVPQTTVNKAKYPAFDMHAHDYARTPEQVGEWIRAMDAAGVEKAVVLTMAVGKEFDAVYAKYAKYPDRFEVWCGFDYTGYDNPDFGPAAVKELLQSWRPRRR